MSVAYHCCYTNITKIQDDNIWMLWLQNIKILSTQTSKELSLEFQTIWERQSVIFKIVKFKIKNFFHCGLHKRFTKHAIFAASTRSPWKHQLTKRQNTKLYLVTRESKTFKIQVSLNNYKFKLGDVSHSEQLELPVHDRTNWCARGTDAI